MPRIAETEIERIKQQTDLAALVRARGVELHKHGSKDFAGKCPFHQDDQPSFIVSPEKGLFHCMGCGVAGNVIQFVQKFDGLSFRHAFEVLDAGPGAATPPPAAPLKMTTVPRLACPFDPAADDATLMGQVVDYYHERLLKTPAALDYLRGRGLYHEEALNHFRLGFADRTLGLHLPQMNRKNGEAIRARLQTLGLFRASGHEHFWGSVVLPIFTADGKIGEMYGRKITMNLKAISPLHMFLPGPHAGIWNAEALLNGELILCEAPFDALTFWVNGLRNVTFIYGTEGFTSELLDAILAKKIRCVYLAYDADEAGNRAAVRDSARLAVAGVECRRVKFPWGTDANEYAQRQSAGALREGGKVQPAERSLALLVNSAQLMEPAVSTHTPALAPSSLNNLAANYIAASDFQPPCPPEIEARRWKAGPPEPCAKAEAADEKVATNPVPSPSALSAQSVATSSPVPVLTRQGEYHLLQLGPREYRIGGLDKNNSLEVLKVTLRLMVKGQASGVRGQASGVRQQASAPMTNDAAQRLMTGDEGALFHLDSFDMTQDSQRRRFIERAAEETRLEKELIKRDLGKLLLALETAQQERIASVLNPEPRTLTPELSPAERAEALAFLQAPNLIEKIGAAFETCGLVGEEANSLAAYLACTSRKLDKPLAVIIQSTSAAGKSTLMEAVLAMFPEEERVKYSAMTGQSLYYLGECDLQHKVLAIVEEEGAEKASYALKLLQSEGELTIASTGKDPQTGRMETQEYHVEGPVMIFLTTTAVDIDEELQNRCLTLTVDESREQTERIHTLQRKARTLEGLRMKKHKAALLALLRNVQRLLQPVDILNPWANELTFTADRTRTRRDHEKYLTLIDAIALLHQHQRPIETDYESGLPAEAPISAKTSADRSAKAGAFIRVTLADIALANRLAPELLGRSLDELPPQTRRVFDAVRAIVRERCEGESIEQHVAFFSRRELRRRLGWSATQVRFHLERLRELEYIAVRYGRPGAEFQYELLTDCHEAAAADSIGLLDVGKLRLLPTSCRENPQPVGGVSGGTPTGSTPCKTGA